MCNSFQKSIAESYPKDREVTGTKEYTTAKQLVKGTAEEISQDVFVETKTDYVWKNVTPEIKAEIKARIEKWFDKLPEYKEIALKSLGK